MDPRRGSQLEYGRSRGGDGGGYGMLPSSSGRAIPPRAIPSLSTGQGFYTVESLQGATMVPPPQPAPPPPRLLPPPEPYTRDFPPPHHSERRFPGERRDFSPFDRRHPPFPSSSRKMMMPPSDMPLPHRGAHLQGRGMLHRHSPPPFMGDPRMPGFFPGRREPRHGWGPSGDYDRYWSDRGRDRSSRPPQRFGARKPGQRTAKPDYQAKSPSKSAAADKKSPADKQGAAEDGPGWCSVCKIDCLKADSLKKHVAGKRHKKQMESEMQVENPGEKAEETNTEGEGVKAVAEKGAEKLVKTEEIEVGEGMADKEGDLHRGSAQNMVVETEGKSEAIESAGTAKPVTLVVGKKRAMKVAAQPKKKIRKSIASSDASKVTASKVDGDSLDANNVAKAFAQDAQVKGADSELSAKSLASASKDAKESGGFTEEPSKEGEDGSKEVREVTDLANGKAGQSAEYQ